jgi:hypothetical protein
MGSSCPRIVFRTASEIGEDNTIKKAQKKNRGNKKP